MSAPLLPRLERKVNIIFRDLVQTRVHFEAAIHRVGEQAATRAFNRALNSEGNKVRTQVHRALRKQTGAKAALINREIRTIRSTFANLTYTIEAWNKEPYFRMIT